MLDSDEEQEQKEKHYINAYQKYCHEKKERRDREKKRIVREMRKYLKLDEPKEEEEPSNSYVNDSKLSSQFADEEI